MLKPRRNEIRKPTKTISGVTPIAVMLPPRKCEHGACIYCPSLDVPQSYTPKSPVVMRASQVNYDSYEQVRGRIKAFQAMHHPTDKIELIIMGGTFLEYPKKFQYEFIKDCYDGLNGRKSESLERAKKLNENAKHRCVALCVETRPDVCVKFIDRLLDFGCTRVELGVQMPDDKIYKKINRGHLVKDVVEATRVLKNAGFKIGYHVMPGLPGGNAKRDLELFRKLFSDENFKPDQLKIYPCQVLKNSELENIYWKGKYKPYTKEQTEKVLFEMMKIVPRYCRVMRVMREIPPEYLVAGTKRIDLRKDIEAKLRNEKSDIKEIRFREVGFNAIDNGKKKKGSNGMEPNRLIPNDNRCKSKYLNVSTDFNKHCAGMAEWLTQLVDTQHPSGFVGSIPTPSAANSNLNLKITEYKASEGDEYFLEIVNENDILFGLLRLRIFEGGEAFPPNSRPRSKSGVTKSFAKSLAHPYLRSLKARNIDKTDNKKTKFSDTNKSQNIRAERGKLAIIRELHIYGKALKLGERRLVASQHIGLGKQLIKKAEEIAKDNNCEILKIISGVGVREYYQKLGYGLDKKKVYMVKDLN